MAKKSSVTEHVLNRVLEKSRKRTNKKIKEQLDKQSGEPNEKDTNNGSQL